MVAWHSPLESRIFGIVPLTVHEASDSTLWQDKLNTCARFLDAGENGLKAVRNEASPLCDWFCRILWQYLCLLEHVAQGCCSDTETIAQDQLLQMLAPVKKDVLAATKVRLANGLAHILRDGWMATTIWEAFGAAVAYASDPATKFENPPVELCKCLQGAKHFVPTLLGFDLTDCNVSGTAARWPDFYQLHDWEREMRELRFDSQLRQHFNLAQNLAAEASERLPNTPNGERIEYCRKRQGALLGGFFDDLLAEHVFYTVYTLRLRFRDQCTFCRAFHGAVKLLVPNTDKAFPDLAMHLRACQCAEADLIRQLHGARYLAQGKLRTEEGEEEEEV